MLVALSIKNFKSIREAHVRFGPFTCFIGHNGVGKSNLFDAIQFLSALTERDISDAATEVRRTSDGGHSPLDLVFGRDPGRNIELSADMVVPPEVADDFGELAKPSTTLLTYSLGLRYAPESDRLLVQYEGLTPAKLGDYKTFVGFDSSTGFRKSVTLGGRRRGPFISTREDRIQLHGDGGSRGRPAPVGRLARVMQWALTIRCDRLFSTAIRPKSRASSRATISSSSNGRSPAATDQSACSGRLKARGERRCRTVPGRGCCRQTGGRLPISLEAHPSAPSSAS